MQNTQQKTPIQQERTFFPKQSKTLPILAYLSRQLPRQLAQKSLKSVANFQRLQLCNYKSQKFAVVIDEKPTHLRFALCKKPQQKAPIQQYNSFFQNSPKIVGSRQFVKPEHPRFALCKNPEQKTPIQEVGNVRHVWKFGGFFCRFLHSLNLRCLSFRSILIRRLYNLLFVQSQLTTCFLYSFSLKNWIRFDHGDLVRRFQVSKLKDIHTSNA